ncbi:MAG: hypothetical protein ABI361_13930 [Nitrososphaera sp.]|jgi:hypothetical protein
MSDTPHDDPKRSAARVVEHQEKFNVPVQTEQEEAETQEDATVEHYADPLEVKRKKEGLD